MKPNKLTVLLIVTVSILLVFIVGTAFAYYSVTLRGQNENIISTSKATLILTEQEDPYNTVQIATEDYVLYEGAPGYLFSISASSTGRAAIAYALYLEPVDGNTIAPEDISINLVKIDSEGNEIRIPEYDYGIRCINEITNSIIGDGSCSNYPEIQDQLYSSEEVTTESNPYSANLIIHTYLFKYENDNIYCNDKKTYYYENLINNNGGEEIISNQIGEENVIVDNSYCTYIEDAYPTTKSRLLVGEDSISNNVYDLFNDYFVEYFNESEKQILEQKNLIYIEKLQNESGQPLNNTVNYKLRYFINSDKLSEGTSEGNVNNDGSISVELGQDGVFKFKIGVYAKSISPS